jgi:hypothetical protein
MYSAAAHLSPYRAGGAERDDCFTVEVEQWSMFRRGADGGNPCPVITGITLPEPELR